MRSIPTDRGGMVSLLRNQAEIQVKVSRSEKKPPGGNRKALNHCKRRICMKYRVDKPLHLSRYIAGQKFCRVCEVWMKWEGVYCPCCSQMLRTKARYGKSRQMMVKVVRY